MTRPRHTTITHDPAHIPQGQFDWLEGKRVVRCATGNTHAVLLLDTGEVVTVASDSGGNEHGQLARGNKYESMSASQRMMMAFTNQQPPPIPEHARHMCIPRLVIELTHVKQIASSAAHCAAVADNGTLFTWGANGQGQCGFSEAALAQYKTEIRALPEYQQENGSQYPDHDRLSATHCNVGALADPSVKVTFVACGAYHTIALTAGGQMIGFGSCGDGELGTDIPVGGGESHRIPQMALPTLCACTELDDAFLVGCAAGDRSSHVVSNDGRVFAMGLQWQSALGLSGQRATMPSQVNPQHFDHAPIAAVSCLQSTTVWLTECGSVFSADARHTGGLPRAISCLAGIRIVAVTAQHFLAENGDLYESFPEPSIGNVAFLAQSAGAISAFIGGVSPSENILCENRPGFHEVFDAVWLAWQRRKNLICCLAMAKPGDKAAEDAHLACIFARLLTIAATPELEVRQSGALNHIFKCL